MKRSAFFLGWCLLVLAFSIAISFAWLGLIIAAPLCAFAIAVIDRSLHP